MSTAPRTRRAPRSTSVVVIGAGPAGLATSHVLSRHGVDHVVLDAGRIGESWRSRRWDSLHLLTPAWLTRLPGLAAPADPDAFLSAGQVVDLLDTYAAESGAEVVEHARVLSVWPWGSRYRVVSTAGTWVARAVVLATGECAVPLVPRAVHGLDAAVHQLTADRYRRPADLPDGGVLIVGASASGVQLADELATAGRDVVLAVGRHIRLPRTYRGQDIYTWLDRIGTLDRHVDSVPDADRGQVLGETSAQLVGVGRPDGTGQRDLSLPALAARGVRLTGRLLQAEGQEVLFADDLRRTTAEADRRLRHLLARIDAFHGTGAEPVIESLPAQHLLTPRRLRLRAPDIGTVIWATGYRTAYPWLHVPGVVDRGGRLRHRYGITPAAGLFAVGLRWQTRRSSSFLAGMGLDAERVVQSVLATFEPSRREVLAAPPSAVVERAS